MNEHHKYYVYILCRPNDTPFYVGKGTGPRVKAHEREARTDCTCHKCKVIRKIWRNGGEVQRNIVFRTPNEQVAYDYELELIRKIGLGNLTNHLPGGGEARFPSPRREDAEINLRERIYYWKLRGVSKQKMREFIRTYEWQRLDALGKTIFRLERYAYGKESRLRRAAELDIEYELLLAELGKLEQLTLFD